MSTNPKPGEVYSVDLGMAQKPRNILVVSFRDPDAPLAVISGLSLTTQFHDSRYEVALPKSTWMRERSFVNAQSLSGYKFVELQRLVGHFDAAVMKQIAVALQNWLAL